jgi:pimeloyl-ACP methyl ester carboxylesterase
MVGDLVCILENAGVAKAVCVGHDWGAQVCYEAARMRPELFEAVIGGVIPVSKILYDRVLSDPEAVFTRGWR